MPGPIVTLTTDFGLRDPYVAEMKAVILSINPQAQMVDITHEIPRFDVRTCAYMLFTAASYFPAGTIHVAVVDPQVGTERRALLIETGKSFFIGPDNGALVPASKKQGIKSIYELTNRRFMMPHVSSIFHGRDIFAPAAAHLASGKRPESFGREIRRIHSSSFTRTKKENGKLVGTIFHVDHFGNLITNISIENLSLVETRSNLTIEMGQSRRKINFCTTYAEAGKGKALALIGSHGLLEISLNQGNAAERFGVKTGDPVTVLLRN